MRPRLSTGDERSVRPSPKPGLVRSLAVGLLIVLVAGVVVTQSSAIYALGGGKKAVTASPDGAVNVSGSLVTPPLSISGAPPVAAGESFQDRLVGLNAPLNSSDLAVINDGPQSYFVTAARMYLNKSLSIPVGVPTSPAPPLLVNGRPTVIYLGAISCAYCAENRWAMALALSRFGAFQYLFYGYSALGDGTVPTLYWAPADYDTANQTVSFGNFYSSTYIDFVTMDYVSWIYGPYAIGSLTYFQQQATALANPIYQNAVSDIIGLNNFQGTPYSIWGRFSVPQADAKNFGTASANVTTVFPISSYTHAQILGMLAQPRTAFAWDEYAAADWYVALICASMQAPTPPVCSLPAISTMVSQA